MPPSMLCSDRLPDPVLIASSSPMSVNSKKGEAPTPKLMIVVGSVDEGRIGLPTVIMRRSPIES